MDLPIRFGFLEKWVATDEWKRLSDAEDALKKEIGTARVTKFECICARVIVKSKKEDRRTVLIKEQHGALVLDFSNWKVPQPKLEILVWAPLWRVLSVYVSKPVAADSAAGSIPSGAASAAPSAESKEQKKDKKDKKKKKD